jgi:hypothetical protein
VQLRGAIFGEVLDMKRTIQRALWVVGISLALSCGNAGRQTAAQNGAALERPWVVAIKEAQGLEFLKDGSFRYWVRASYPALDAIANIGNELQKRGFRPVDEDLVVAGAKNSHVTGWVTYLEKDDFVYRWMADWVDPQNNGVTYRLIYRYVPAGGGRFSPNDHLEIAAVYASAADLEKQRRLIPKR